MSKAKPKKIHDDPITGWTTYRDALNDGFTFQLKGKDIFIKHPTQPVPDWLRGRVAEFKAYIVEVLQSAELKSVVPQDPCWVCHTNKWFWRDSGHTGSWLCFRCRGNVKLDKPPTEAPRLSQYEYSHKIGDR